MLHTSWYIGTVCVWNQVGVKNNHLVNPDPIYCSSVCIEFGAYWHIVPGVWWLWTSCALGRRSGLSRGKACTLVFMIGWWICLTLFRHFITNCVYKNSFMQHKCCVAQVNMVSVCYMYKSEMSYNRQRGTLYLTTKRFQYLRVLLLLLI